MDNQESEEKPTRDFLTRLYDEIKAAVGESGFSLDAFTSAVRRARAHAGGMGKAKKRRAMAEMSLTDIIERVNAALSQSFRQPLTREAIFYYAKEVYAERVIACSSFDGKLFEIPYTMNGDEVMFGEPVEVEETFTPVGMNELATLCAKDRAARLFIEASFAEPPDWIPYLPKPGEFKHPLYGEIAITKDRNNNFVNNFKAGVYQERLPVDAEHETKLSGAVGWITDMRVNADGSADARVEWTDRGTALIEADRFRYVSPEWYDRWTAPDTAVEHEDVAIGAALTTRPFFKESSLRPLIAGEHGLFDLDEARSHREAQIYQFAALAPVEEKETRDMAEKPEQTQATDAARFTELETQVHQLAAELSESKTAAEARAQEVKQLSERNAALERESRTRRFSDVISNGKWLGTPATHIKLMERLGEETEEFAAYVAEQTAIAEQARAGQLFAEVGTERAENGGAFNKIKAQADQMVSEGKAKTFAQAVSQIAQANPQLYKDYQAEKRSIN